MNSIEDEDQFKQNIRQSTDDNHRYFSGLSPKEGVRLVQSFAGIRNPAVRKAVVNFIRELEKASD